MVVFIDILTNSVMRVPVAPHLYQPLSFIVLYNFNNSVGLVVISHWGFHLFFPDVVELLFQMFFDHWTWSFMQGLYSSFVYFLTGLYFYYRSVRIVYIFWKWARCHLFLLYILFPFWSCLFTLIYAVFSEQNFLF